MSYDDTRYVDRNTALGNCQCQVSGTYPSTDQADDAPGQPAGTKLVAPGEDISSAVSNRRVYQAFHNTDILKEPLDSMIATTVVGALTTFTGSSITIDPVGTAGDIDLSPAGYVYVGNSGYTGGGQEERNTLFQILDEDYNEVMVEGEEVVVTNVSPVLGSGFYNGGLVTLTLNKTLPSGNYRVRFGRDTTLATLPDDALIKAVVNGQEWAAENAKRNVYVLSASTTGEPADYMGPTALQDAIADLTSDAVLFLRNGTYTGPAGAPLAISQNQFRIIGESRTGVIVEIASGYDLDVTGDNVSFEDVTIQPDTPAAYMDVDVGTGASDFSMRRVTINNMALSANGPEGFYEDVKCGGYDRGLDIGSQADGSIFNGIYVAHSTNPDALEPLIKLDGCNRITAENVITPKTGVTDQVGLHMGNNACSESTFRNFYVYCAGDYAFTFDGNHKDCTFQDSLFITTKSDGDGMAKLDTGDPLGNVAFERCSIAGNGTIFNSDPTSGVAQDMQLIFRDCSFDNFAATWYNKPAFVMENSMVSGYVIMDNCVITDQFSKGVVATSNPGEAVVGYTSQFVVVQLQGVRGSNLIIDRSGMTHMVMDTQMITVAGCRFDGMKIEFGTGALTPFVFNLALTTAVITFWGNEFGNYIRDLEIGSKFMGEWTKPLVYVAGRPYSLGNPARSFIDGLVIHAINGSNWWIDDTVDEALALQINGDATVRGFIWGDENTTSDVVDDERTYSLVRMSGSHSLLEDSQIYVDCRLKSGGGNTYVRYIIAYEGTSTSISHNTVRNCRIYARPRTGAVQDLEAVIYLLGQAQVVEHNYMLWTGDFQDQFIYEGGSAYFCKILNNHLCLDGATLSATDYFIQGGVSTGPTHTVLGNTLQAQSGANPPEIYPNTVVGYAQNVRVVNAIGPDTP